jgi:hypothetical protein
MPQNTSDGNRRIKIGPQRGCTELTTKISATRIKQENARIPIMNGNNVS